MEDGDEDEDEVRRMVWFGLVCLLFIVLFVMGGGRGLLDRLSSDRGRVAAGA
jgi:hypothetical protein